MEFPVGERPKNGRRIELIGMRRNINQNMQKPAAHLVYRAARDEPDEHENGNKNNGAVAYAVKRAREAHDRVKFSVGWRLNLVRPRDIGGREIAGDKTPGDPDEGNREGEEVRKYTPKRSPPDIQ